MPTSIIKERLNNKIIGPISLAFMIYNWNLVIAFTDLTTKFPERITYIRSNLSYENFSIPALAGLAMAFFIPIISHAYTHYFELKLLREDQEERARIARDIEAIKFLPNTTKELLIETRQVLEAARRLSHSTSPKDTQNRQKHLERGLANIREIQSFIDSQEKN